MQSFINNIVTFVNNLISSISIAMGNAGTITTYNAFLTKDVFMENSLIGINITWLELIRYLSIWILVILFIVLFVKFILKILGLFRFNRLND